MAVAVRNLSRDRVLAEHGWLAKAPWTRARGMIGRRFDGFDAMIFQFRGAASIHTWCMHMPLDVVFADGELRVVKLRLAMPPWRLAAAREARFVIELPAGTVDPDMCQIGDRLSLETAK